MMKMMKMMKTLQVGESELSACSRRSFHSKSDHPAFVIFKFLSKLSSCFFLSSFPFFLFIFCSQDFTWSGFSLWTALTSRDLGSPLSRLCLFCRIFFVVAWFFKDLDFLNNFFAWFFEALDFLKYFLCMILQRPWQAGSKFSRRGEGGRSSFWCRTRVVCRP